MLHAGVIEFAKLLVCVLVSLDLFLNIFIMLHNILGIRRKGRITLLLHASISVSFQLACEPAAIFSSSSKSHLLNNWSTLPQKILGLDAGVEFKIKSTTVTVSSVQRLWAYIRHRKQQYKGVKALALTAGTLAVHSLSTAPMLAATSTP